MNSKSVLAVIAVLLMAFSAVPLSDVSAEKPEAVERGFVLTSEPTHEQYDEYICMAVYEAQNIIYALGFDVSYFDYDVKLSNIVFKEALFYDNYYFDTDETGIEQYFTEFQIYTMDVKVIATLKDDMAGKSPYLDSVIGDTDEVKGIIGGTFMKGDKITANAKLNVALYKEYDETDMLRDDGKYIMDSWDIYSAYAMDSNGDALFSVNGKDTEVSFKTIDSSEYTSVCNWKYRTDLSDVKTGDKFDYDRNNRVMLNVHSCDYYIGNGVYNLVNTATTSTSYMDVKSTFDDSFLYTLEQINGTDYIYQFAFDKNKDDMAKIGKINESASDAYFEAIKGNTNYIEMLDINMYDQKTVDSLNADINGKQTLVYALSVICIVLIIALIVFVMKSKKTA